MKALEILALSFLGLCCSALGGVGVAAQSQAGKLDMDTVNSAEFSAPRGNDISPTGIKAQVFLDRARFSPGVIDGHLGDNLANAIKAFEKNRNLNVDGKLDEEVWSMLSETSKDPVLIEYTITDEDVKGPFAERIPEEMEKQASLERLAYTGPAELLSEKFHMDEDLLKALNPGKSFDKAGTTIVVANVNAGVSKDPPNRKLGKIEIDKKESVLRALAEDGSIIAVYPASVGSEEKPAPSGAHTVRAVAKNPTYTYNPDYNFKGVKTNEKFEIKPGPNNPVGSVWIDLSIESYGIHGTPNPAKVGKAYSHGCVRLTNWDVEELAKMVEKGTAVAFLD